jgi:hypothetical protein
MIQSYRNDTIDRISILVEPEGEQFDLELGEKIEIEYENNHCYDMVFTGNNTLSLFPQINSQYPVSVKINGIIRNGGFHLKMMEYQSYHSKKSAQQLDSSEPASPAH